MNFKRLTIVLFAVAISPEILFAQSAGDSALSIFYVKEASIQYISGTIQKNNANDSISSRTYTQNSDLIFLNVYPAIVQDLPDVMVYQSDDACVYVYASDDVIQEAPSDSEEGAIILHIEP